MILAARIKPEVHRSGKIRARQNETKNKTAASKTLAAGEAFRIPVTLS
jgi:hypothetical protein